MPKEIIDVLDTAVKIGLGALISGVAAYLAAKSNHKNEKEKELLNRRLNKIEHASENIDEFFNSMVNLISAIDGILIQSTDNAELTQKQLEFIRENDKRYTESRDLRGIAVSWLRLHKLDDCIEILIETNNLDRCIREKVIFEKVLPTKKENTKWKNECNKIRKKFFKSLSQHYCA